MSSWIQLSKETARSFYRVPADLTAAEENNFFGVEHHPMDADGPWPLAAFLRSQARPSVLTFQIYTIESEARESAGFNPLAETGGYLALNKRQAVELARLLAFCAEKLEPARATFGPMFAEIDAAKLGEFRIRAQLQPGSRDYFYRQASDLRAEPGGEAAATLLIFSIPADARRATSLYLKVAAFPTASLAQPSFDPLDDALAKIALDRGGAEELAALLERRAAELAR